MSIKYEIQSIKNSQGTDKELARSNTLHASLRMRPCQPNNLKVIYNPPAR